MHTSISKFYVTFPLDKVYKACPGSMAQNATCRGDPGLSLACSYRGDATM